jgi:hypothetical protein
VLHGHAPLTTVRHGRAVTTAALGWPPPLGFQEGFAGNFYHSVLAYPPLHFPTLFHPRPFFFILFCSNTYVIYFLSLSLLNHFKKLKSRAAETRVHFRKSIVNCPKTIPESKALGKRVP